MGSNTSGPINSYTYIGGNNYGTNKVGAQQIATNSIPVTATEGINPAKFTFTDGGALTLLDYIHTRNTTNTLTGHINIDVNQLHNLKTLTKHIEDEDSMIHRGQSNITRDMLNNIVGTVTVGTGMQDLINKGVTRLSAMAENSLGHDLVTPLFRNGLELGLKLPTMFSNLYSIASSNADNETQEKKGGLLNRQQTISVGGSNLLPMLRPRYTNTSNLSYYNRGTEGYIDDNSNSFFIRACEKENELIENVKKMIIDGQKAIFLPTVPNDQGDAANVCPTTALITGKQTVDVGTHIKDLETTLATNFLLEQHQTHANVLTAAMTSSTPQIAIPPKSSDINDVVKNLSNDELDITAEAFRLSGSNYNVLVADDSHDYQPNLSAEFMQGLTDSTLIPTSQGCRVSMINRVKNQILHAYPIDDCTTEALIADPHDVSLIDLDVPQYYETDWLNIVRPIPNTFNTIVYPPDAPVNHVSIYDDIFTKNITSFAGCINSMLDAFVHNNTFPMLSLVDKSKKIVCAYLPYNFSVMDAFVDYDVAFRFEISYSMTPSYIQLTAKDAIVKLNALMPQVQVGLVTADIDGTKQLWFLPISPYDYNKDTGTLSFEYSELIKTSLLGTIVDINNQQIVPTDGHFTFAIVVPDSVDSVIPSMTNWNLNVNMGTARLTRKETSQNISNWIYNGAISNKPFIKHFFLVYANDTQLNHPFDVTEFWKNVIIQKINPFLRSIVRLLQQDEMSPIITAAWTRMKPHLLVTNKDAFKIWLMDTIIDMPNWMFWKANSTLTYIKDPDETPNICFDVYKMARHIITLIPYDSQNVTTISSALENLTKDPTFTKGDSMALRQAKAKSRHNLMQMRSLKNLSNKQSFMHMTSGL